MEITIQAQSENIYRQLKAAFIDTEPYLSAVYWHSTDVTEFTAIIYTSKQNTEKAKEGFTCLKYNEVLEWIKHNE